MMSTIKNLLKPLLFNFRFLSFLGHLVFLFIRIKKDVGSHQTIRGLGWIENGFSSPAPNFVKWKVLRRWGGDSVWIETGTYLGETTRFLSEHSIQVLSIEPSKELVELAREKFKNSDNVEIIQGTSEEVLDNVLKGLSDFEKSDINFWLDGHYSAGITYLGEVECPIPQELNSISNHILLNQNITIFIDDVRSFSPTGEFRSGYPSLSYLTEWADSRKLYWTIEHDIFIMTNRKNRLTQN